MGNTGDLLYCFKRHAQWWGQRTRRATAEAGERERAVPSLGGGRARMGAVVERRQTGLQDRLQRQKGGGHKRSPCQPDFRGAPALLETTGTGRGASGGLVRALVSISRACEVGEMGGCRSLEVRRIWVESRDVGVNRQLRRTRTGDEGSGFGGEGREALGTGPGWLSSKVPAKAPRLGGQAVVAELLFSQQPRKL